MNGLVLYIREQRYGKIQDKQPDLQGVYGKEKIGTSRNYFRRIKFREGN